MADSETESPMKKAAEKVGFSDTGTPPKLYMLWRKQVHRGVQNWDPEETGTSRWDAFCEWAAGQPTHGSNSRTMRRGYVKNALEDRMSKLSYGTKYPLRLMVYQARETAV